MTGRPTMVFAVVFSNYSPAETDSIWWTLEEAKERAEKLGDMWEVQQWTVGEAEPLEEGGDD